VDSVSDYKLQFDSDNLSSMTRQWQMFTSIWRPGEYRLGGSKKTWQNRKMIVPCRVRIAAQRIMISNLLVYSLRDIPWFSFYLYIKTHFVDATREECFRCKKNINNICVCANRFALYERLNYFFVFLFYKRNYFIFRIIKNSISWWNIKG